MASHAFEVSSVVAAPPEVVWARVATMEGVNSPMLSQRRWVHERTLEAVGTGCRVTDRVWFEPRCAPLGAALLPVFEFFFRHRHRRLARFFGARAEPIAGRAAGRL